MPGSRPARVADQLRAELTDILAREVHDPRIGFLTVTHVKVSADLQVARVYYTTLGDQKARQDTQRALERATSFVRRHIGQRLRLKRVPEIDFHFDEAIERGDRVEKILQEIGASPQPGTDGAAADLHDEPDDDHYGH